MGDILRIYSGGAQVNLYDSTNGILHLGYASEDILIESESQSIGLSDGNRTQIEEIVSFEAIILQTDETQIDNLMTRRNYLQEVYIIGIDSAFKMRNCFLRIKEVRSMKGGETHQITISGQRYQQSVTAAADLPETKYCQFIQNILGSFGNCDTDGGGGIATGWSNSGGGSLSVDTSHLGGGYGNEQRVTLSDGADYMFCRSRFPLDQVPIKITVSAYVDNRGAGIAHFVIGFQTRNAAQSPLDTENSADLTVAIGADGRKTFTKEFTPSAAVHFFEFNIRGNAAGTAEIGFDNVQLEIGGLTNYLENA